MEHISYFNISPIQYFVSGEYDDMDLIKTSHDSQNEVIDIIESAKDIDNSKINIECFDDRGEDILENPRSTINVKSKTLDISPNTPEIPKGSTDGVIAKIPVVLAQLLIPINITSFIDLPEEAIKVKDINKRLNLIECVLIQATNVLFIKGFVRKNIDYSTGLCSNLDGVCGAIHHCTIDVPFECTTPIDFSVLPDLPLFNERDEFGYLRVEELPRDSFAEKDHLMSKDFSEYNQNSTEFFNKLPFCDLISSNIVEFDEFINRRRPDGVALPFEERLFTQIEEKMVIQLSLRLLQEQQVTIPSILPAVTGLQE